jgi:MFS family permease
MKEIQSSVEGRGEHITEIHDQKRIERRLLLKTDAVVLPLIVLTSTLAFLDKVKTIFSKNMRNLTDFA